METITINIPENKIAEQSTSCNGSIIINFKDKPKEKDWWQYIVVYEKYVFDKVGSIIIENRWGNNPLTWPIEYKFGLLKFIANDLNGEWKPWCTNSSNYQLTVNGDSWYPYYNNSCIHHASVYFSKEAISKAEKIIPVEFIKSF